MASQDDYNFFLVIFAALQRDIHIVIVDLIHGMQRTNKFARMLS